MPRGHERLQTSHAPGYERIRRLADQQEQGRGSISARTRRSAAAARPGVEASSVLILFLAMGGGMLLLLLGWFAYGKGVHPFCAFR